MFEPLMWKRCLAVLGACLLLGLTACSSADDDPDAQDPASSDSTASDGASDDSSDGESDDGSDDESGASDPQTTSDPTKGGGWKFLPECDELARSIVKGQDIVDDEQVAGRSCRFTIGEDRVLGRQIVWIARGGGGWPSSFQEEELNEKLSSAADPGEKKYESSVSEIDAPGWDYGFRFDEKIGKTERTSYRLLAFAKNDDLLSCHTSITTADLEAFRKWCDKVLASVQP